MSPSRTSLSLEDDNVFQADLPLDLARAILDGTYDVMDVEKLASVLDLAQGWTHMGKGDSFLVIRIHKEDSSE